MNPLVIPLVSLGIEIFQAIYAAATMPAKEAAALAQWAIDRVAELRVMRGSTAIDHDALTAQTLAAIAAAHGAQAPVGASSGGIVAAPLDMTKTPQTA